MNKIEFLNVFQAYASNYNLADPKILLKYIHTEKVAENSERIARSLCLSKEEEELAWQIGVLHDIGRFEQLRRYDTFNDAASIDHADFGADLLFKEGLIRRFFPELECQEDCKQPEVQVNETGMSHSEAVICKGETKAGQPEVRVNETGMSHPEAVICKGETKTGQPKLSCWAVRRSLIETAIRCHNRYRLPEGLTEYEILFCNIIRDADKADIFRANYETGMDAIYNVTIQELKESTIAPAVYEAFMEGHAVLRSLKRYPIDHLVGHLALSFEFVFPETGRIVAEQGFLWKLAEFHSENQQTEKMLDQIRGILKKRIEHWRTE